MTKLEWEKFIDDLHSNEKPLKMSKEDIIFNLSKLVENIILEIARSAKGTVGVLFSGGVDSTIIIHILHKHKIPFIAVTIGFQDNNEQKLPEDILKSRIIAKKYGFSHVEKLFSFDEIQKLFFETVKVLGEDLTNAVNIGVGSVEIAGVKLLKEQDSSITTIFGGLGSEELFAGYKRHADSIDKHNECWNGLRNIYERDLLRDFAIKKAFNISFGVPFLDKRLISFSMGIPIDLKINDTSSKIILREAALKLGLDRDYAFRPKKAAQYGSRTDKAISKLAKKAGFSLKKEYLAFLVKSIKE
jgi:asparagine synthase (glutamine-hydrolysing)